MPAGANGLPPTDHALPGLRSALRGDAVGEFLRARLRRVTDAYDVVSCTPCYVRYKPGTNCLVQYGLRLRETETGRSHDVPVHAKLYANGQAERVWSKGALEQLAREAADLNPDPPIERAFLVPELRTIVQIYPVDAALPHLPRVASQEGMREVLPQAAAVNGAETVELVRYKPARKALLRYVTRGLFAKLHADGRGGLAYRAGAALRQCGVRVARPIAYLPALRMVVHDEAPGRRLGDERETDRLETGAAAAGTLLARLHAARIAKLPIHTLGDEAAALGSAAEAIATVHPRLADSAYAIAAECSELLAGLPAVGATCHGDFDDDQVLVAGDEAVLVDLDSVRISHPTLDVGRFLARLSTSESGLGPRRAFLDAYAEGSGARIEALAVFEAAGLIRLAIEPFRRLDDAWPEALEERLKLASRRLREHRCGRPVAIPVISAPDDPSLPQLAVLTDPAQIAPVLAQARGERVLIDSVAVVRHKPRRRCTLRLDLAVGPPGAERLERLYAKTYSSERAPRVYRSLRSMSQAKAFGPTVTVPEPVGCLEALKTVLHREVKGQPAGPALLAGDEELSARIATAIHTLHTCDVQLDRDRSLADEVSALRGRVDALAEASPSLAEPARRCLAASEAEAARVTAWRRRPVHRDFYPEQILVQGSRLAVLDLDDVAMSEPALDVANFLAHLRLLDLEHGCSGAVDAAASAFLARYMELDPALDPSLVRLLEGATLLRLACIHLPREDGEQLAKSLLRQGDACLSGGPA